MLFKYRRKLNNYNTKKNIYPCFIESAKVFVWIITNCGKLLKRWEYQTILPISWETCMQVKKQQLGPFVWNKWLIQNWEGSTTRLFIVTPVTSCEMLAGWVISWNQDCGEKYQQPQKCTWYHFNDRKQRGTKEPLDEGARGEWKSRFKTQYLKKTKNKKTKIVASSSIISWQIEGEKVEAVTDFFFLALKSLRMVTVSMKSEDDCFLAGKLWQT